MLSKITDWFHGMAVDRHRRSLSKKIEKFGWTANYVFDKNGSDHIDFAYTIGFSDFDAPELIVFSLDPQLINYIFWELFEIMRAGKPLHDGFVFRPNIPEMESFECTLRAAVKPATHTKYVFDSIAYNRAKDRMRNPEVMQIVWPSAHNGKYPWSPGCPASVIDSQPALFETAPTHNVRVFGRR